MDTPAPTIGKRFESAFNARDEPAMQSLVTDDVEIYPFRYALENTVYHGRAGLHQWLADVFETWSELQVVLEDVDASVPGLEFATGRLTGRGSESTALIEAAAGWVIETHDGLARRLRTFVDVKAARDLYEVLAAGVPRFE